MLVVGEPAEPWLVTRSAASSGTVEPWLVSLPNHGCMVEQTLKQVQGDSKLLFDILKFFCFYCHTRIQILNRNLKVIFVDNLAWHFAAF